MHSSFVEQFWKLCVTNHQLLYCKTLPACALIYNICKKLTIRSSYCHSFRGFWKIFRKEKRVINSHGRRYTTQVCHSFVLRDDHLIRNINHEWHWSCNYFFFAGNGHNNSKSMRRRTKYIFYILNTYLYRVYIVIELPRNKQNSQFQLIHSVVTLKDKTTRTKIVCSKLNNS